MGGKGQPDPEKEREPLGYCSTPSEKKDCHFEDQPKNGRRGATPSRVRLKANWEGKQLQDSFLRKKKDLSRFREKREPLVKMAARGEGWSLAEKGGDKNWGPSEGQSQGNV